MQPTRQDYINCYYGILPRKTATKTKSIQMYRLTYRGQIIVANALYGVCAGKRKELNKDKNYSFNHFKIEKV
jgi:hypothetical protein